MMKKIEVKISKINKQDQSIIVTRKPIINKLKRDRKELIKALVDDGKNPRS